MRIERVADYKKIISTCYAEDEALVNRWHQSAGGGLEKCIEDEFSALQSISAQIFRIEDSLGLAGYFAKEIYGEKDHLTGFFLMPRLRNTFGRRQFWACVEANFRRPFICSLYENNRPAVRFIESRGAKKVREHVQLPEGLAVLYRLGE